MNFICLKKEDKKKQKLSSFYTDNFSVHYFVNAWKNSEVFFFKLEEPWPEIELPKAGFIKDGVHHANLNIEKTNDVLCWLTPTVTEIRNRSDSALKRRAEYRASIGRNTIPFGCLAEQVLSSGKVPIQDINKAEPKLEGLLNPDWVEWLMGFPFGWSKENTPK